MEMSSTSRSTNASFSYDRLGDENSIRLLSLLPEDVFNDEKLHGALVEKSLIEAPPYAALSYTLGNVNPPCFIYLDSKAIADYKEFTLCTREAPKDRQLCLIWTNAICIDQCDIVERNNQVYHMRRIYRQAEEVVIDVGLEADGSGSRMTHV